MEPRRSPRAHRILHILITLALLTTLAPPPAPALPTEDLCDGDVSLGSILPIGLARADDDLVPDCVGPGNGSTPTPCREATTPDITLTEPPKATTLDSTVTLAGSVTRLDDGKVEVKVTQEHPGTATTGWRTASHDAANEAWSWSFDTIAWTRNHGDGEITAQARATTQDGCRDTTNAEPFTVDNRPTVTLEQPVEGDGVTGSVTLKGTTRDRVPGVDHVRYQVDGGSWRTVSVDSTAGMEAAWSTTWDTTQVADGEHTLIVEAVDGDGVRSHPATRSVHTRNDLPPPYRHPQSEPDTDLNGLGDSFETAYDITDAAADLDGDGLPNVDEFRWDTIPVTKVEALGGAVRVFPNAQDYDADQWPDGPEAAYWEARTNDNNSANVQHAKDQADAAAWPFQKPLADHGIPTPPPSTLASPAEGLTRPAVSQLDTDGDGVPNMHDRDSDNDGLQDGVEIALGTYPDVEDSDCYQVEDCPPSSILSTPPTVTEWPDDTESPPVGPSITTPYAQAPKWTAQGVVGAWSLDPDDAWRTWPHLLWDQSGHGHDLAPWKAPSTERTNATWGNYSTLEPGSRLTYPGLLPIEPTRFTLAAHVRPASGMGHGTVVSQNLGGGHCGPSFGLHVDGQGRPMLVYAYAPDDVVVLAKGPTLPNGWSHVAGTFDGSEATIWVDGKSRNTELVPQRSLPAPVPEACSGTFSVGRTAFQATALEASPWSVDFHQVHGVQPRYAWYWDGDVDDILVANNVLLDPSIEDLAGAPFDADPLVDEGGERGDDEPEFSLDGSNVKHPPVPDANPANASQPGNRGDGLNDSEEYDYWENEHDTANWDSDSDGDGVYNLLDWDSDNDGCSDGGEVHVTNTDPADATDCTEDLVEAMRDAERSDPRNEDLEELHPVNEEYLQKRRTDQEARANKIVEVDEEAAYEYTREQVEAGLNVTTRGTPLNEPVREVAREAFSLVDPGAVAGCLDATRTTVDRETRLPPDPPENMDDVEERRVRLQADAKMHGRCLVHALTDPVVAKLQNEAIPRVAGIGTEVMTGVTATATTTRGIHANTSATLSDLPNQLGDVTNSTADAVNATRGDATSVVKNLSVTGPRSFLPEFLRNLTTPVEHPLVGSGLYGAVQDIEEAAGVPLVEAVDSTHADLAVHNGTAWVLVENVPTGVSEGVDVDGDGTDELRVTVTNRDNTLPLHLVPGRTDHAPHLQVERLDEAGNVETVAAFLQHPDTPHVTVLAVSPNGSLPDAASVGLRAAHIRDEAPAMDVVASTSDGPAPAFHASVIPVEITEEGKTVAKGRTVSMNLTAPALEGTGGATVTVENGTHGVRWNASTPGNAQVTFVDVNGTDSYGARASVENGPAAWSLTRDTTPHSVSWTGDGLGDPTGGLVEAAAADAVTLDLRDTLGDGDDNVTVDATGVQSAWSVTATPGSSISVNANEAPESVDLVDDRGAGECTAPSGDHASLVHHDDVNCLSVSLQDVPSLDLGYHGAMPAFTFQGDNSIRDLRVLLVDDDDTVQADLSEQPASVSWDGTVWEASERMGNALVAVTEGGAVHRLDVTDAASTMRFDRDATAPSFHFTASNPVDSVTLEVAPEGSLPNVTGDHVALRSDGNRWLRNDAWSVHLQDTTSASFDASNADTLGFHVDASNRDTTFSVTPDARLEASLHDVTGHTAWNATSASGFTYHGSASQVTVDARVGEQILSAHLEDPAPRIEVEAPPVGAGERFTVESTESTAGLRWTRAPATNAPSVLPGEDTVTVHREDAAASVHANLASVTNLTITRDDAELTVEQTNARDLQAHLRTGGDALTLTAGALPTSASFAAGQDGYRYRATAGTTARGFTLQGTLQDRPVHWNATRVPSSLTVVWMQAPPTVTLHHTGVTLGSVNLTAATQGANPNLHLDATNAPSAVHASVSDAWNRTLVTTRGTGEVGELTLHYGPTGRIAVPTGNLAGYVLAKQADPDTSEAANQGGSLVAHATDTKRVAATMDSGSGSAHVMADGTGTGAYLLMADPVGRERLHARFNKSVGSLEARTGFHAPSDPEDASSAQVHLEAAGAATLPVLHHETRHRVLRVSDAAWTENATLRWTEGGTLRASAPHPADIALQYGDSVNKQAPGTAVDHVALHEAREVPQVGIQLTDVTTLHLPTSGSFHVTSTSNQALHVERTLPSADTRLEVGPLDGATSLHWNLTAPNLTLDAGNPLTTVELDAYDGTRRLAVRFSDAPAGETRFGANTTRLHLTAPTRTSVGDVLVAFRSDGEGDEDGARRDPVNLLGGREGVAWAPNPTKEGDGDAPVRDAITVKISNVKSLELLRGVGSMEVQAERTTLAPTVSARFVSIADETTGDVTLTALGSSLNTQLKHNGNLTLTHDTTESGVGQAFKLKAPQGFLELTAHDSGDIHTVIKRPSQEGRLHADGADITLQATGAFGAVDLEVADHPASPLTWTVSENTGQGTLGFGSGSATHVQALLAPSNTTEHRAMHAWSCPRDTCVFVDTTRHPAVAQVEAGHLESVSWSLSKLGQPWVDLDRGYQASGRGNLTLHDGEQTLYLRSDSLAEDVRFEASDPLVTPQGAAGASASPGPSTKGTTTPSADTSPTTSVTYTANEATDVESGYRHDGRFTTVDAEEAPSDWSVTESGDQAENSYEMTWDGTSDSDDLEVQSNVHPQGSTELSAVDAPSDWTARIEPGDCGSTTTDPFQARLTSAGGDFQTVTWVTTQDGTVPTTAYGVKAVCENAEGAVKAILDKLDLVEAKQDVCAGYLDITATSRRTPYALATTAGLMTGEVALKQGSGQIKPYFSMKQNDNQGNYGYTTEGITSTEGIRTWSLTYRPLMNNDESQPCTLTVKNRPVQWVRAVAGDLPSKLNVRVQDPATTVTASSAVGSLRGEVKLGKPTRGPDASQADETKPVHINVKASVENLDFALRDGAFRYDLTTESPTQFIHVENGDDLFALAKVTGLDRLGLRFEKGCPSEWTINYDGDRNRVDYYSNTTESKTRINIDRIPTSLGFDVEIGKEDIQGNISSEEKIGSLRVWKKNKQSSSGCGSDRGDRPLIVKLEGIPGSDDAWPFWFKKGGRAFDLHLKPLGGQTIDSIYIRNAMQNEWGQKIYLENVRVDLQFDLDGDTRHEGQQYIFLDTGGKALTGGRFHVTLETDTGPFRGIDWYSTNSISADNFQIRPNPDLKTPLAWLDGDIDFWPLDFAGNLDVNAEDIRVAALFKQDWWEVPDCAFTSVVCS